MRIQHNIAAMNSYRQLGGNNNALSKNLEKLSSGFRINRAGDDAAGLAISEKMRAKVAGLSAAKKNAGDGISLIQTAEGALNEVHSMMKRMEELCVQASNGVYGTKERAEITNEIAALKTEIGRISQDTTFNDIALFNEGANAADLNLQVSDSANGTIELKITGFTLANAALSLDAVDVTDAAKSLTSVAKVKAGIEVVSGYRGQLGAVQNRLEHTVDNLGTTIENLSASESRIRDTDMADEMMAYTKNNILVQAAQAMLAQANQVPQGVLQLLQ